MAHFVRRNVRSGDRTHHSRSLASEASYKRIQIIKYELSTYFIEIVIDVIIKRMSATDANNVSDKCLKCQRDMQKNVSHL